MEKETRLIAFGHRHPIVTALLASLWVTFLAIWNFPGWTWIGYVSLSMGFAIFVWLWCRPGGIVARLRARRSRQSSSRSCFGGW